MDAERRKSRVAWLSVVSNTTLVLGKLVVGLLIGSVSVVSEAIHSAVDLVAAAIALAAVKAAAKPADEEHPFGHGKIENISGTIEALLIFVAGSWIIYEAVHRLLARQPVEGVGLGVLIMLVSAVANYFVSQRLFQVGRETDSIALQADGWHLRTDVWTSGGVMAGLLLMAAGHALLPGVDLGWIDPVAAIAVALLIYKAAWDLTRESLRDVVDASLPPAELEWIHGELRGHPEVKGIHHLRTRKAGSRRFVEFHLVVEARLPTVDAHRLADHLLERIRSRYPNAAVTSHLEPCDGSCRPACREGCLLSELDRNNVRAAFAAKAAPSSS
jgi:cation diffusion facilitator family transporter